MAANSRALFGFGSKAVSLKASRNFHFTPKSRHPFEGQLHRRRKGRRCRGVFEKGEEIVFGPDGDLERDTGKDQEIVASLSRMAEAALRIGSCSQWIALPARCGRAPPLLTTCRRAALPQSAG